MSGNDECLWEKERRKDGYLVYRAKIEDSVIKLGEEVVDLGPGPEEKECWARDYTHPKSSRDVCRRCLDNCPNEHRERTVEMGERGDEKMKWGAGSYHKMKLIKQRGPFCERCEEPQGEDNNFLEVHHRNKDRSENQPSNLNLLCKTCHNEVHAKNDIEFLDLSDEELEDSSDNQSQLEDFQ